MRLLTVLLLLLAVTPLAVAQPFEGKITYKNEYTSKMANVATQQLNSMMGTTQEYLIKGGNYKSSTNGTYFQWQLYVNNDNKLYNKMSSSPALQWNDGSVNADVVIHSELNKGVATILGHPCDELILTCKSGVQKYYFSSALKVDPQLYQNHKFGNWSEVISRCQALPLKISLDNKQFTLECVATAIKPMKLDDKIFQLPPDSKLEKSAY